MRKHAYLFLALMLLGFSIDGVCQLNRKAIKRNNRRISNFKGKKSHFSKDKIYSAFGFSLNALNYYGDLAPRPAKFSTDISFTRPALAISFSHRFGPRYTLTSSFMYGTLRGSDAESADRTDAENGIFRYNRNLSFRNRIKELSVVGVLDLFKNESSYINRVKWTPYAFVGVSVFHHNPQAIAPATDLKGNPLPDGGKWVNLRPLGTEGQYSTLQPTDINYGNKPYKLIQFAIPFGLGARFRLTEVVDFSAELGFRYLFTDYIDDVSKNYVDLGTLNGELARAMSYRSSESGAVSASQLLPTVTRDGSTYNLLPGYGSEYKDNMRGNSSDRDVFMVTTFRLTYIIGKTFHRAKFR